MEGGGQGAAAIARAAGEAIVYLRQPDAGISSYAMESCFFIGAKLWLQTF